MVLQTKWNIWREPQNVCDMKMSDNDYICSDFLIVTHSLMWDSAELAGGLGDFGQGENIKCV